MEEIAVAQMSIHNIAQIAYVLKEEEEEKNNWKSWIKHEKKSWIDNYYINAAPSENLTDWLKILKLTDL